MPTNKIYIKIIGAGKNKFGLRLLGLVARIFHINLEIHTTEFHPSRELKFDFLDLKAEADPNTIFTFYCTLVTPTSPRITHPYEGIITQQLIDHFLTFRAIIPDKNQSK